MSRKLASLKKLIGRIIQMVSNFLLQFGITLVPFSAVVLFFAFDKMVGWAFCGLATMATLMLCLGFYSLYNAVKQARFEEQQRHDEMRLFALMVAGIAGKLGVDVNEVIKAWKNGKHGKRGDSLFNE